MTRMITVSKKQTQAKVDLPATHYVPINHRGGETNVGVNQNQGWEETAVCRCGSRAITWRRRGAFALLAPRLW